MATIVVTGASGFIGRHLAPLLAARGHAVVDAGRRPGGVGRFVEVGTIGGGTDWRAALAGADAVIHLAGLAHGKASSDAEMVEVNDNGTRRLCEAVEAAGTGALVAVSSIAARDVGRAPARLAAYARSKLAGERHVVRFAERTGRCGISIRPPLVYGHDAPANWKALQRLAAGGLPLPFGAVENRRSLCAVENLCGALAAAAEAGLAGAPAGTYEVSDAEVVSLADIVRYLRGGMGKPARLVPVPMGLLRLGGRLTGRSETVSALVDDLVLDPGPFMNAFDWRPAIPTPEGVAASGRAFVSGRAA